MKLGQCKISTDYKQALFHMYKMLLHMFNTIGIFVQILAYTFKKCCKTENENLKNKESLYPGKVQLATDPQAL